MPDYRKDGLSVIRATLLNGKFTDEVINHVPPMGMDISEVNLDRVVGELIEGIQTILEEFPCEDGQEIIFYMTYTKEAAV